MKKCPHSFLFCLLFVICIPVKAQHLSDSATYYYHKIIKPTEAQDLVEGYLYYKNESDKNLAAGNIEKGLYALNMISIAQIGLGVYYDAEKTTIDALKIVDQNPQLTTPYKIALRTRLYNNLGLIHKDLHKKKEAITNYKTALTIAQKAKDSFYIYNNLGLLYHAQTNYKEAREYFVAAHKLLQGSQDSIAIAVSLDSWGMTEVKLNNPEGLAKIKNALALRKRLHDESRIYASYRHLTYFYKDKGAIETAIIYADSGIAQAKKYSVEYLQDALYNKLALSNNPTVTAYLKINDSIATAKFINENKFSSAKYNLEEEKREKERALLESAEQKATNKTYQFIGILIIILTVFLLLTITIWNRKKRNEQVYLTETRISKIVHDEVSNDVYQMMTQVQQKKGTNAQLLDSLENIYKKTRNISREHSPITVDTDFETTLKDLFLSYHSDSLSILTRNSEAVRWDALSHSKKVAIYRVLQELITNTIKHSEASIILIEFSQKRYKMSIFYKDNGIGGSLSNKNGLQNVENRISIHKGTITFDSQPTKGFTAQIQI